MAWLPSIFPDVIFSHNFGNIANNRTVCVLMNICYLTFSKKFTWWALPEHGLGIFQNSKEKMKLRNNTSFLRLRLTYGYFHYPLEKKCISRPTLAKNKSFWVNQIINCHYSSALLGKYRWNAKNIKTSAMKSVFCGTSPLYIPNLFQISLTTNYVSRTLRNEFLFCDIWKKTPIWA